mmetsp:Transcript_15842/g.34719  ORF Transcript_15842/g.34719 Transcript_15842/m.34719 type:complete len:230 (-) Transcript_15842:231-920(-)
MPAVGRRMKTMPTVVRVDDGHGYCGSFRGKHRSAPIRDASCVFESQWVVYDSTLWVSHLFQRKTLLLVLPESQNCATLACSLAPNSNLPSLPPVLLPLRHSPTCAGRKGIVTTSLLLHPHPYHLFLLRWVVGCHYSYPPPLPWKTPSWNANRKVGSKCVRAVYCRRCRRRRRLMLSLLACGCFLLLLSHHRRRRHPPPREYSKILDPPRPNRAARRRDPECSTATSLPP